MIYYIKGIIKFKSPNKIVIENNGIGYHVLIPLSTFQKLPPIDENIKIYIHYQVKEDTVNLIGFFSTEERDLFENLITVSSIGVRTALNILSHCSISNFKEAVIVENFSLLSTIPGIGKKTAQRIVLELKDKLKNTEDIIVLDKAGKEHPVLEETIEALISFGYKAFEARKATLQAHEILGDNCTIEEYLKQGFKYLVK